jgi:hypothetical protein
VPRILNGQIEIVDDWHPLSGQRPLELIPPCWVSWHCGQRLADAFNVLGLVKINGVPTGFAHCWPNYSQEFSDLAQFADDENWKQERRREFWAATREIPTREQITRMEIAISWPMTYLREFPQLIRSVQACALARSRRRSIAFAAHRLRQPHRLTRQWNNQGLDLIAVGLQRDAVRVF